MNTLLYLALIALGLWLFVYIVDLLSPPAPLPRFLKIVGAIVALVLFINLLFPALL